jgi:hypothetical protein
LILSKNGVNLPQKHPVLAAHLESFGPDFKGRGAQGEHWWNLRACSFYEDFEVDRVVWIELTLEPRFAVCPAGVYMLNTAYFLLPPSGYSAHAIVALLNASVSGFYMKHSAQTSGMGVTRWFKEHVAEIPIPDLREGCHTVLDSLARCRMKAEADAAVFLEDLIDACVLECYFREHMAERDLLFLDDLALELSAFDSNDSETDQRNFIAKLHRTLNAPRSRIRNRLLRISADSPDLLAVIRREGGVSNPASTASKSH